MPTIMHDPRASLNPEEIERMINATETLRDRLVVQMLARTGARTGEVVGILINNIIWNEKTIIIQAEKKFKHKLAKLPTPVLILANEYLLLPSEVAEIQKTEKKKQETIYRRIAIDSATLELARQYILKRKSVSPFLFPGQKQNTHIHRFTAYMIVRDAAKKIGIINIGDPAIGHHRAGNSNRIHPGHHVGGHVLRHSLALNWLSKAGTDMDSLRKLQMQLGHASPATTMQYLLYTPSELHSDYDKVFPDKEQK